LGPARERGWAAPLTAGATAAGELTRLEEVAARVLNVLAGAFVVAVTLVLAIVLAAAAGHPPAAAHRHHRHRHGQSETATDDGAPSTPARRGASGARYHSADGDGDYLGSGKSSPRGRAVQVDPIKPTLKAPGSMHSILRYDGPVSNFAFKFNLCRYSEVRSGDSSTSAEEATPLPRQACHHGSFFQRTNRQAVVF
jgi:hypothetical protein